MEGNGFRDRIQDFNDKNAVIVGISIDPAGDNKAFKDKFDFPYDLLSDADTSMSKAYGVDITDSGRTSRKSVLVGPDGKVAVSYDPVTPAEHPDQVLADLAKLG
ncbi:MAG: peroxiredoxin [Rhodospirillaceae bacterium]|nr:peroxiredoxin [Rhodospirillaceae bacterium]MBT5459736.1 peroxiredoxin [Rhodospirillaceae bacterium]